MATFEAGPYLEAQLRSIAEQTRVPDELVACDDASSDDTLLELERFARGAPFAVRVEQNPQRLGPSGNFERAVSLCSGEVVFLADQDDVWLPRKIERLCRELDDHPGAGAVFCNGRIVDAALRPRGGDLWQALFFSRAEQRMLRSGRATEVFLKHVVAAGTTMAFRSAYRDLYLPFPPLRDSHDAWVAFLIAAVADFRIVDEDLIVYRVHGANRFGLHRLTLFEQLEQAKQQLEVGAFRHAVSFFSAAGERLEQARRQGRHRCSDRTLALVREKVEHSRARDRMPAGLLARAPAIARELFAGRYARYSYGLKSVAQDVFLR